MGWGQARPRPLWVFSGQWSLFASMAEQSHCGTTLLEWALEFLLGNSIRAAPGARAPRSWPVEKAGSECLGCVCKRHTNPLILLAVSIRETAPAAAPALERHPLGV